MHPYRRFRAASGRKKAAALVVGALVMSSAGFAGAQWILNTGNGSVVTAASVWVVNQTGTLPVGDVLAPTGSTGCMTACVNSLTVGVTVTNTSNAAQTLGTLYGNPSMVTDGAGVFDMNTSAYVDACPASNFSFPTQDGQIGETLNWVIGGTGPSMTADNGTVGTVQVAAGQTEKFTFQVKIADLAPAACQAIAPEWALAIT